MGVERYEGIGVACFLLSHVALDGGVFQVVSDF